MHPTRQYLFYAILFCLLLSACGPTRLTAVPFETPTAQATQTPAATASPTATKTPTSTITLTPTLSPPPAVTNLFVNKKGCLIVEVGAPNNIHYEYQNAMLVKWTDVQGEDGYWLYRDGDRIAELPADTKQFADYFKVTKGGRTSVYYMISYNSAGQTKSELFAIPNPC